MTASAWSTVPIGKVIEGLYDGPHATPNPSNEGPVFLGIKNVSDDGFLDLTNVRHISEAEFPRWTKRVLPQAGDIVFTYEATLNRYALIPEGFRGCLGRRMALIRPDEAKAHGKFLYYAFFGPSWRATTDSNILSGSTVDRIPLTKFPDFPIDLPPLPIQKRISAILSAYDDLIEVNTRRIAILEEMARRIYEEWFVRGADPAWELAPLENLIASHIGGGWGKDVVDAKHVEPAYVIRGTDVPSASLGQISSIPHRYHAPSNLKSRRLAAWDIVFEVSGGSKDQPVGRVLIATPQLLDAIGPDVMCASFCKRIVAYDGEAAFLYETLKRAREIGDVERFEVQSTGIKNLGFQKFIAGLTVSRPPAALRRNFQSTVQPIYELISTIGRQNSNLRAQRDLLLPRLVSGKLDVSELGDLEKEAADA